MMTFDFHEFHLRPSLMIPSLRVPERSDHSHLHSWFQSINSTVCLQSELSLEVLLSYCLTHETCSGPDSMKLTVHQYFSLSLNWKHTNSPPEHYHVVPLLVLPSQTRPDHLQFPQSHSYQQHITGVVSDGGPVWEAHRDRIRTHWDFLIP